MNSMISMGTALCVHVSRLQSGELAATFGIEGNAEVRTEAPEFCEIERNSYGASTVPAHLLFPLLGSLKPMGIKPGQLVSVLHDGLDLIVVRDCVPALSESLTGEADHSFPFLTFRDALSEEVKP
jgi:hypothetical protein